MGPTPKKFRINGPGMGNKYSYWATRDAYSNIATCMLIRTASEFHFSLIKVFVFGSESLKIYQNYYKFSLDYMNGYR